MIRNELIATVSKMIHDSLLGRVTTKQLAEAIVATVEGPIREDEQALERGRRIDRYDTTTIQEVLSDERERLHAKVEALPALVPDHRTGRAWVERADVLALLDGGSE